MQKHEKLIATMNKHSLAREQASHNSKYPDGANEDGYHTMMDIDDHVSLEGDRTKRKTTG